VRALIVIAAASMACATAVTLTTAAPPEYNRTDWRHWVDDDKDCQDARQEVLIEESAAEVTYVDDRRCRVASGRWEDPYTGTTITDPSLLDVDHVVALRDAHDSGGWAWDAARRRAFANDLDAPEHLRAVARGANRSKGSRGPDEWLPPNKEFRCAYIEEFTAIKGRWDLSIGREEGAVLEYMTTMCNRGEVPPLPQ
jgi:hypothetical protein